MSDTSNPPSGSLSPSRDNTDRPHLKAAIAALTASLQHHCEYDHPDPDMTEPCKFKQDVDNGIAELFDTTINEVIGEDIIKVNEVEGSTVARHYVNKRLALQRQRWQELK